MYAGLRMDMHRRLPIDMDNPGSTPRYDDSEILNSGELAPREIVEVGADALVPDEVKMTVGPLYEEGVRFHSFFSSLASSS